MARLFHVLPYAHRDEPDGWGFECYVSTSIEPGGTTAGWEAARQAFAAWVTQLRLYPVAPDRETQELAQRFSTDLCKAVVDLWAWRQRDQVSGVQFSRGNNQVALGLQNYPEGSCFIPQPYNVEVSLNTDAFFTVENSLFMLLALVHDAHKPSDALIRYLLPGIRKVVDAVVAQDQRVITFEVNNYKNVADPQEVRLGLLKLIYTPLMVCPQVRVADPAPDLPCHCDAGDRGKTLLFYQQQSLVLPLAGWRETCP
jgi:hypothetical protein